MSTQNNLQQLRVKSYFAATFQDAMEQAQREMGQDALLLNSREAPPEARHLGKVEVVFGTASAAAPEVPTPTPAPKAIPAPVPARKATLSGAPAGIPAPVLISAPAPTLEIPEQVDDVHQNLRDIRNLLTRLSAAPAGVGRPRYSPIEQTLIDVGIGAALALDIEEAVNQRLSNRGAVNLGKSKTTPDWRAEELLEEAAEEIACRFDVDTRLNRVTALVGPPGCGKTTTLIKLALTEGLMAGRAVRLISADTHKIGAAEQLRTYAAILGVPFEAVETTAALAQAVNSAPENELVLIDTPGFSAFALETSGGELAELLSSRQDFDVHLVLTASMRAADMARAADRFSVFGPTKLLFTKLDETDSLAPVFCEVVRQKRPLSFLSNGQLIPEDIAPASRGQIAGSLVRRLPEVIKLVA